VRDRDARLQSLLSTNRSEALRQAYQINEANARFNLGDFPRSINVPTMALGLRHPKNGARFKARVAGRERSTEANCGYWSTASPYVDNYPTREGRDQSSKVTAWVDASNGAIYKTTLEFEGGRAAGRVETKITVDYDQDPHLTTLAPRTMMETYFRKADLDSYGFTITGKARYSNYRDSTPAAASCRSHEPMPA